ncbi:MAG TPA: DUF6776 family protein [Nitrosospira sp.]|nr:DUF6776 family protein [Nitrosospira sp.]
MQKKFKRKTGIFAPRVAIRPETSWRSRWLIIGILAVLALVLSWGMYDAGRKFSGFNRQETDESSDELARLSQANTRLQQNNEELRMKVAGLERQLQMDLVTHENVIQQVKTLEKENTRLTEDLAFFQNLGNVGGKEHRVSIGRLKLERGQLPGEYRYSVLLVQGGRPIKDFQGSLEFEVSFRQNGEKKMISLAGENPSQKFDVKFKFYQRIDRSFRLPADAVLESMQVKVFENGLAQARLTQTVNLPS